MSVPPLQVEKIRQVKAKSLYLQVEKLHQSLTKLDSTIAAVSQVLDEGRHLDVLLARERMLTQIHELKALRGLLQPQEDDRFMFTPPDQVGSLLMKPPIHDICRDVQVDKSSLKCLLNRFKCCGILLGHTFMIRKYCQ